MKKLMVVVGFAAGLALAAPGSASAAVHGPFEAHDGKSGEYWCEYDRSRTGSKYMDCYEKPAGSGKWYYTSKPRTS